MMESVFERKRDFTSRIKDTAEQFVQFTETEFSDIGAYFSEKVNENVIRLLNIDKPKVMVYGIYNSGKSTLINALCKEEVAEMADRPMTDRISEYDRGDYFLIDSPGVDAPIEHEMITEEHINRCHIILFVISSKGLFEDRTNYEKLSNLIKREIPFIIVLNDRGYPVEKKWSEEEKKRARFEHDQNLKITQYKIIQNLVRVSGDQHIADKYEVIILNAKKALMGIQKNKPQLYEASGVEFLDRRISQMLNSDSSISAVLKQPISNLKECLNETEKMITQIMSGNTSEDFGTRLHTLERKKDNIMEDMRILTLHAVQSRLDELTNSYMSGDADIFETIANTIFVDIDGRYEAKLNELLVFVDHNFKDLNLFIDGSSNLIFDSNGKIGSKLPVKEWNSQKNINDADLVLPKKEKGFFDFLKSRKKREQEKQERLEQEAKIRNEQAQYKVQENIRRKQEARQLASSDLDVLYREFVEIVNRGLDEKYDNVISQIQQIDCINKQIMEDGKRQMLCVKKLRKEISAIENSLK